MSQTDRSYEEDYLQKTLTIVNRNIKEYGEESTRMQGEIDEMLEHYHDADVELWTLLNNTITMNEHMKRALSRNERALSKPYFGRIIFQDETLHQEESLYIGKGGISEDHIHQTVVDWRAPVANAYYENGLGKCSYQSPEGKEIPIDLQLKRTFEILDGKLIDYVDSEVVANDDLLMKYLSKNKEAVLGEIVATIQKEQNDIIRKSPFHNCIVQGVAGSGKTTVAMHRISYILYNYQERFRPEDFYIVGSNQILLNYITGVLPDLDVYGVKQMTMEQLMIRLLYEDWDGNRYTVKNVSDTKDILKGTTAWFQDLMDYIRELEERTIDISNVYLNPRQFVEGLEDGKNGVYDRTKEDKEKGLKPTLVKLVDGGAVLRYVEQNPRISIQSKINMLNERLYAKISEEFLNNGYKYTEPEKKAILRSYRAYYGSSEWKKSIFVLYNEFLQKQAAQGKLVTIPDKELDVYDLAALALLYKLVKETEVISEAHHIVIDEAQDFGMMIYRVLEACIKECTYTIMGDTSQNIHFGYGLSDWRELRKLLLQDSADSFCTLRKSYRNTIEISEFATNILKHGNFPIYPVEPIIRHGKAVSVIQAEKNQTVIAQTADICKEWQIQGYETIAIVTRTEREAAEFARQLKEIIPVIDCSSENANFGNGIMVLPVNLTKGLEFDTVLLLDPSCKDYPKDDGHAKLLYVAATRALHELTILHENQLSALISEKSDRNNSEAEYEAYDSTLKVSTINPAMTKQASTIKPVLPRVKAIPKETKTVTVKSAITSTYSPYTPGIYPKQVKQDSNPVKLTTTGFGDMPETSLLRPMGHAKINQAIRWVTKDSSGVTLQSQYGTLRILPINKCTFRILFQKGSTVTEDKHPLIKDSAAKKQFTCKESMSSVLISLPECSILIQKQNGAIQFMDSFGKIILTEKVPESRQQETEHCYWYLSSAKKEVLVAFHKEFSPIKLKGSARYISNEKENTCLPLLISDSGYGIVTASTKPVIYCDIPAYGTYLSTEESRLDFYLIAGANQRQIINTYDELTV